MTISLLANAVYYRLLGLFAAIRGHCSFEDLVFEAHLAMGVKPLGSLQKGKYEASELAMLRRVVQKGDRVLEVGSGMGFLALNAAKIVGPDGVYAVEANPMMVKIASRNAAANALPVRFHHGVVSESSGTAKFRIHRQFWRSALVDDHAQGAGVIAVPKLPWGDVLRDASPSIVIIDIEGGEVEVCKF